MRTSLKISFLPVFFASCVFETPFESNSTIPVKKEWLGEWETKPSGDKEAPEKARLLKYSDNEYLLEYPVGKKAMFFRAFSVALSGAEYLQVQLIGTNGEALKLEDRKYHLLKMKLDGDQLSVQAIAPDLIGKDLKDSAAMKAAFAAHKDDPALFEEAMIFKRIP